jgi:hypothetical protein
MRVGRLKAGLLAAAAVAAVVPAAARADTWEPVKGTPSAVGAQVDAKRSAAFTLDLQALRGELAGARKGARAVAGTSVLEVPAPDGTMRRFAVRETSIMEPGLAAKHPEIKTYAGRGLDDPTASIVADTSPLGFHASVRARHGAFYVDPYYKGKATVHASYYTRDAVNDEARSFVESEAADESLTADTTAAAGLGPEVQLRTYRLALVTDPSYANYFGAENVTAAKVTLMNRVNQIYNTESAIKLVLIADNDKLNLNTVAQATGPNGPCGAAPCYTATNSCGSVLDRNRFVIGQIIGADKYDIGHIAMGNSGGGVAGLGVVGGANKARGCTGLSTPVGDYFAVDYVTHEMGHQFNGNHTFNGVLANCGGNRSGANSVEPGSGSSIMAYAGICGQDNLQPHSDPYWVPKSYEEILSLVTNTPARPLVNEVQNVALRGFDGTDSFTLSFGGKTVGPFINGVNYTAADIQGALSGQEVQAVRLTGYDANGDAYTLSYGGAESHAIVRGQNNTAAGIANALVGGNEQQQLALTGFNANTASFTITVNGQTTAAFGQGGTPNTNANVAAAINAILGATGTATVTGAGNGGFTVTFAGALANTDVPAISVASTAGTATVRELAKGGTGILPAGATVAASNVTDAGYSLLFGGTLAGQDVEALTVTGATGAAGTVVETTKGSAGIVGAGATAAVTGFFGGTFNDTGFQVSFGGALAGQNVEALTIDVTGATGFVGETNHGGQPGNQGFTVTPSGNHAPDVTVPATHTIPPRTPFALTGSATDPDGDPLTYMWEQVDQAGIQGVTTAGTALLNQTKTNGVIFRQLGVTADVSPTDALRYNSPGLNLAGASPTRTFPDMLQILAGNTNAATGRCEAGPIPPVAGGSSQLIAREIRECFSEFLPTTDWLGFLSDRSMTFRMTARDGKEAGGIGFAQTKVTVAPLTGPFRVTSQATREVIYGTTSEAVTWDVAGTDVAPVNVANVKISLSTDGGLTYPTVLAESTPNDGSHEVTFPSVNAEKARIKVEAIGNVFFDVSHADLALVQAPTLPVGGTVPATLSLTLGTAATFPAFVPGVANDYTATSTANVISTAGDATLSVSEPGHMTNGAFSLAEPLRVSLSKSAWTGPVSNDSVEIAYKQLIKANDPLRTGTYSKTLTFTLSTTNP